MFGKRRCSFEMFNIIKYIHSFVIPPGLFITLMALAIVWLRKREKRAVKLLGGLLVFIYALTTPLIGNMWLGSLEQRYQPPAAVHGDAIVLLTGGAVSNTPDVEGVGSLSGSTMNRTITAYKLHRSYNLPIIISGGQPFSYTGNEGQIVKRNLLALGVPESQLLLDDKSRNTAENALNTAEIIKYKGFAKPILVTSAFHMQRSVEHFDKVGIMTAPYPTDFLVPQPAAVSIGSFIPSAEGMMKCSLAAKEFLGLLALTWQK
jgi:uncharacterized SAM-binding protein YcdF (DUF218 family)